ncbi:MAG: homoserine dehydrogenase [Gammaproteobacteria bacterium]|nr:homoserine dehydrogenase [Gammaproteobacteria bacterium]
MPVKVGLCGLGTVGRGTVRVLSRNAAVLAQRSGVGIELVQIGARNAVPDADTGAIPFTRDIFAVATNPEVDILVELIGGIEPARELVLTAIANGKQVVTANKALIATCGNEIFAAARARGVTVAYEASVAGGIPIIKALREGLAANRIRWLAGIINGTSNFILSEMRDKGRQFADVLAEAQLLGYAEADPTLDVEGIDAAHKLVILAALAFGMPLRPDAVYIEGITAIQPEDVVYAGELGYRIKHLGVARRNGEGIELRVHPTLVPERSLIAQVHGVMNAIMVKGDAVGATLYCGPGAGAEPTASAVIADILDIARRLDGGGRDATPVPGGGPDAGEPLAVLDIAAAESAHYLRVSALDKPGVLSQLAQILSTHGISVEAIIQKEPAPGQDHVPLIMLTNRTRESEVRAAIGAIERLESVSGPVVHLRKEALDDA